jgi:hypothetical protein
MGWERDAGKRREGGRDTKWIKDRKKGRKNRKRISRYFSGSFPLVVLHYNMMLW